ncbi:MAG: hypothetical protein U0236_10675 [Nitrospira sp.]
MQTSIGQPNENPTKITRPNGAITTRTYDPKSNLLTSTEPSINATTTLTYDATFNQVTSLKGPKNQLTTITHDAKGNPLTITDADNKIMRFFDNTQGLLTETRDALYPANPATTFTYDTLGRLLTIINAMLNPSDALESRRALPYLIFKTVAVPLFPFL